jgi:hypothetical protein
MALADDFASVADSSAFIFGANIVGPAHGATRTEDRTVTAVVIDVLKAPAGMGGLVGREMTVHLREPLTEGHYVLFADPVSIGSRITVRETAHLSETQRDDAVAAMDRGYAERLGPRLAAARLVALGTIREVTPLLSPSERAGRVSWALARFDTERILKGPKSRRRVILIGPSPASKRLPRTPALSPGVHAVLLLQRPPEEAMEHVPDRERQAAGFIADTSDIQPADRAEDLDRILRAAERE